MKREPGYIHFVTSVGMVLLALFLSWTAAFYITGAVYSRIGWEPHGLFALLINATLGFVLFGTAIAIVGPFLRPREHHFFTEMNEALKRISRGDFRVNIEMGIDHRKARKRQQHPYVQLVNSINDMAANLKAMEELRQEFISNVSHEIGTPLTSISGFAKALKDERLDLEQRHQYLTIIETECVRLSKLSDNLMKLAVLDSAQQTFHPAPYRLDKQLVSLLLACEPQWEAKKIDMSVEAEEVEIIVDEDQMSQVWLNLIHNAIKFTPHGGSISIFLARDGDQAAVRIADTGQGIAEQDQPRIFERFYKADKSRTRTAGGSGLGLSIAHKITELHGGSISVCSKPGEGTEFTVLLPWTQSSFATNE
ncbi:Adaptive-response sensory-kinase SasA [Paenibacillus plantiphilus]|uniref:histidine kinase n=1 Tax=Paenibacillus plantiphilus TaxID=2905650 RepID=A0ABM9C3Y4_9BACL|nr:HAMP domain-containing sensor histidine kinase [Paenibacillus plantiphilus]CAH1200719.1 Adaptive-response sensory-kinase SasA [Paenibacillus plantiphilus]